MKMITKATLILLALLITIAIYVVYPHSSGIRQYNQFSVTTFSKDFINVHLVSVNERHILIDAGLASYSQDIESFLLKNQIKPADIDAVIVTHAHHDHAGTAKHFQQNYNTQIIGGAGDLTAFQTGKNGTLCPTSLLAEARYERDQQGEFPPFTPDILVYDKLDLSELMGVDGVIYNISGHTDGSLVIVFKDVAFVGDLVRGGLLLKNRAATHFYQCNLPAISEGLKKLLYIFAPSVETFYPSHLGPVSRSSLELMTEKP